MTTGLASFASGRGWRMPVDDPGLPGLAEAADPGAVARLLDGVVAVQRCQVVPVRHRPGQRAVLRYDIETGSGPLVLFGKVVRDGAAQLANAFDRLHEWGRAGPGPFVPAPVMLVERLGLVILPLVDGRPLHAFAFDATTSTAELSEAFRAVGRAVAGLHRGPPPEDSVQPRDDVDELERQAVALRAADPALASRWTGIMERLEAMDSSPVSLVPSHGALRTDQVVLSPQGPALLDLDSFCAARPARDLGNLLAYLRWRAMRRPADAAAAAIGRGALLEGYAEVASGPDPADLDRHEGLSLLKIAARRYRNLDVDEWPLIPDLVDAAASLTSCEP
jgi:hypothetical protein